MTESTDSGIIYRSIDGSGNNLTDPQLNAAGTDFARVGPAQFADGISQPVDGPNPRTISNTVVGQGGVDAATANNSLGLSGMMYAWGQFIDHDLDLAPTDGVNHIDIPIPNGDPVFADGSKIPLTRAVIDPATGTDPAHPATAINSITGWLDASMVYGSDTATAASLRLPDGHMATSAGNNLPIVNGSYLAGDVRAAENPSLTALQTLFVREHNFQVDQLAATHPDWSGDQLYNQARAIVGAEIPNITYSEFLPHLLGPNAIAPYSGYDPNVDPRITLEFAGAAYRFGHSIVSGDNGKIAENGTATEEGDLRDAFFEPPATFAAHGGADGALRNLASEVHPEMDGRIVDDLRNFLSDPPDVADLAAINIERGRDLGIGTLNQTREALGFADYSDFSFASDPATSLALSQAFSSVDQVDLWTGGLSEAHAPGALVGPTFQAIIAQQFTALRDGDRLWFENQGFDPTTLTTIENTSLADIIRRDTNTQFIQDDVFTAFERHSGTKGGVEAENPAIPQLVVGSPGSDTLTGGSQGDLLFAARGAQTLTGDGGADRFSVTTGTIGTVTDFQAGADQLVIRGDQANVQITDNKDGNAVVSIPGLRVELLGVAAAQLPAGAITFEPNAASSLAAANLTAATSSDPLVTQSPLTASSPLTQLLG